MSWVPQQSSLSCPNSKPIILSPFSPVLYHPRHPPPLPPPLHAAFPSTPSTPLSLGETPLTTPTDTPTIETASFVQERPSEGSSRQERRTKEERVVGGKKKTDEEEDGWKLGPPSVCSSLSDTTPGLLPATSPSTPVDMFVNVVLPKPRRRMGTPAAKEALRWCRGPARREEEDYEKANKASPEEEGGGVGHQMVIAAALAGGGPQAKSKYGRMGAANYCGQSWRGGGGEQDGSKQREDGEGGIGGGALQQQQQAKKKEAKKKEGERFEQGLFFNGGRKPYVSPLLPLAVKPPPTHPRLPPPPPPRQFPRLPRPRKKRWWWNAASAKGGRPS
eukprot:GHVS01038127.1.p1 GENE.GHVS01038127.1~~GHVS01038127.1.p1  ORF type:complete len:332 (+),score=104.93 GHVS01038127.1:96-1091(+)